MNLNRKGLLGTISFHSIVVLLLIFYGIEFPWPPPEAGGIEINFGNSETGFGDFEPAQIQRPRVNRQQQVQQEEVQESSEQQEEGLLTQDYEEAPAITTPKVETPKKKPEVKKEEKKKPQPERKKVPEEEPVDDSELFSFNRRVETNNTGSQGITSGSGNQGRENGTLTSNYYGDGGGTGNQREASLAGRTALNIGTVSINYQNPGYVVVTIKVNKEGRVLSAVAGIDKDPKGRRTTITDANILKQFEAAAKRSTFNRSDDAPFQQSGTITYTIDPK